GNSKDRLDQCLASRKILLAQSQNIAAKSSAASHSRARTGGRYDLAGHTNASLIRPFRSRRTGARIGRMAPFIGRSEGRFPVSTKHHESRRSGHWPRRRIYPKGNRFISRNRVPPHERGPKDTACGNGAGISDREIVVTNGSWL